MVETIREYLVALGFQVDDEGWRGFNEKLVQSGRNAARTGVEVAAMALQITAAIEQIADQYEHLDYVSQRTGQSVSFLRAYEFGARQIGLTADQARGSLEAMHARMRTNPGVAAIAGGLGVKTPQELAERLKAQYGNTQLGYSIANNFASQIFGTDETVFKQMWDNVEELRRQQDASAARARRGGLNPDELARQSKEFMNAFRDMNDEFDVFKEKTVATVIVPATDVIKSITGVMGKVNELNAALGGTLGVLLALGTAWGGAKVLMSVLGRLGLLGTAGAAAGRSLGVGSTAMRFAGPLGAFGWGLGLGGEAQGATIPGGAGKAHPSDAPGGGASDAVRFFQSQGWTYEQAVGIAANLKAESNFNHRAVGDGGRAYGLGQWHPDRQADFKNWAGKDIRESTMQEQLAFVQYELLSKERRAGQALKSAKTSREAASVFSTLYERPRDLVGEAEKRAAMASSMETVLGGGQATGNTTNIAPNTTINISGVSDPQRAANLVGTEARRMWGNIDRFSTAAAR